MRPGGTLIVGTTLLSLAAMSLLSACGSANSGATEAEAKRERVVPVIAQNPYREDAVRVLSANGDVAADRQVTVFSAVAGRIVERNVNLASSVRDSQIIITVDHSALDLAVEQVRAGLAAAEQNAANLGSELVRVQRLYAERGTSQQQLDAVRTQKIAADKVVEQTRASLDQTIVRRNEADIRAPFNGVIGKIFVEVGDMVGPGVPVAIVVAPAPLIAKVQIPERDLGAVYPNQSVTLTVAAYGDSAFRGTVRRISPVIDPMTRMAEVEALLPNTDRKLKPGMFATVSIEVDRRKGALMVPSDAVLQETRLNAESIGGAERVYYMFVKNGDRAVRRNVTLGYTTGYKVEIRSGITATDSIIVRGHNLLQDGQAVTVPSSQPAS
jgi:RND family efflux transporter MFP subunit